MQCNNYDFCPLSYNLCFFDNVKTVFKSLVWCLVETWWHSVFFFKPLHYVIVRTGKKWSWVSRTIDDMHNSNSFVLMWRQCTARIFHKNGKPHTIHPRLADERSASRTVNPRSADEGSASRTINPRLADEGYQRRYKYQFWFWIQQSKIAMIHAK